MAEQFETLRLLTGLAPKTDRVSLLQAAVQLIRSAPQESPAWLEPQQEQCASPPFSAAEEDFNPLRFLSLEEEEQPEQPSANKRRRLWIKREGEAERE